MGSATTLGGAYVVVGSFVVVYDAEWLLAWSGELHAFNRFAVAAVRKPFERFEVERLTVLLKDLINAAPCRRFGEVRLRPRFERIGRPTGATTIAGLAAPVVFLWN